MATGHVVTAGCVVARYADNAGEGYFYEGALLPDIVSAEEKQRLVDVGLVEKVELVVVETVVVDPLDALDLAGLQAYAVEHKVDLGRATQPSSPTSASSEPSRSQATGSTPATPNSSPSSCAASCPSSPTSRSCVESPARCPQLRPGASRY